MIKRSTYISSFAIVALSLLTLICSCADKAAVKTIEHTAITLDDIGDQMVTDKGLYISIKTGSALDEQIVYLILSSTYATIVVEPEILDNTAQFYIPPSFTKRSGVVNYSLYSNENISQEGEFTLLPDTNHLGTIETYLGPRSIVANVRDYTMLVSIPTDTLDNTLPDNTQVALKSQFKSAVTTTTHPITSGFVWKRISSPLRTGRVSTGSTLENISSKELVADVFPDVAQNFRIEANSNHNYADGNEIISFQSTQIRDEHGNVMTDGTLVTFYMTDATGAHWQNKASTVNGYAFAKALHPQSPTTWNVRAAVTGIAQSNTITQQFKSIITSIPTPTITERNLTIGPLTSYLGQLVQNGIDVSVTIGKETRNGQTKNGEATFYLKEENYPAGTYDVVVRCLGLESNTQISID